MKNSFIIKIVVIIFLVGLLVNSLKVDAVKFNMSYLYGNYNYASLVLRTNGGLDEVSPSYFDIKEDGSLKLNTVDASFVQKMHNMGVKVVPFLSNHWDRELGRKALANRENLADQIVKAINTYNLDGVNIDIENVTNIDKENYTSLVRIIREKLPEGKSISVAVAANPNNWQTGWHGSYDYENLSKYADYLMIMTYDEHYESGEVGPVASIQFVENSIKYALSKTTGDKIVLGIPFFGRYWKEGASYGGYGVPINRIENLISTYDSKVYYDENTKSVKAIIKIKEIDTKPVINYRTLNAGTYVFWYENKESIESKLDLVNKYNLKGTGSWSLGQEGSDTWEYYMSSLNQDENSYVDVKPNSWYYDAVEKVKEKGYMNGKEINIFAPEDNLTRAEFAVIISRMMELESLYNEQTTYKDTENHWAKKYIESVTKLGFMNGRENGNFAPDNFITREEVSKVLSLINKSGEVINGNVNYNDISEKRWSYNYILDISKKGLIKGYPDGNFGPERLLTRAEMAEILSRII